MQFHSHYKAILFFGSGSSNIIVVLQRKITVTAYDKLGFATVRALQSYLDTAVGSVLSSPSIVIKELQRRLNVDTF